MTTTNSNSGFSTSMTNFGKVFWYAPRNTTRFGEVTTVGDKLVMDLSTGWNPSMSNAIIPVEDILNPVNPDGLDYVAIALKERQEQWDKLKLDVSADGKALLTAFESLYTQDGKLVVPELLANACFQRGAHYLPAMAMRLTTPNVDGKLLTLDGCLMVPVSPRKYANEQERIIDQLLENESKLRDSGQPISDSNRLRTGKKLYDMCLRETRFREIFKSSTTGQKIHGLCYLDQKFPNVKILARLQLAPTEEGYIPYGPISHADLTRMKARHRGDFKQLKGGAMEGPLTEQEVSDYFNGVKKGGNKEKIMSRKDIETIQQSPVELVERVATAVINKDAEAINAFAPLSIGFNALMEFSRMGIYPEIELLLVTRLNAERAKRNPTNGAADALANATLVTAPGNPVAVETPVAAVETPVAAVETPVVETPVVETPVNPVVAAEAKAANGKPAKKSGGLFGRKKPAATN